MSRNPHEPNDKTRSEVEALSSFGIPQDEIADYVGVDAKTLRKHYRDELDKSEVKANAKVGQFLFSAASGKALENGANHSDCVRAAMFWAKTRMQWRETNHHEVTGKDGSPVETVSKVERVIVRPEDSDG